MDCSSIFTTLLEKNLAQSSVALRELLGPVTLQAVYPDLGKPYYIAHSSIDTMALIEMPSSKDGTEDGSTTLRWWTWTVRIRTFAEVPFEASLIDLTLTPIYQNISEKCSQLQALGLSYRRIAKLLSVDEKTVSKAISWLEKNNEFVITFSCS